MNKLTILKNPELERTQDYAWLRAKGLEHIQELGSKFWTDYNLHDPGITLLEQLCFAQTELGYRTSYEISDLLAVPPKKTFDPHSQGFFTPREILTCNPWTIRDFRKLLIDIDGIKNGWLSVMNRHPHNIIPYVNNKKSALQYRPPTPHSIQIRGLYEVSIEFDDDDRMGNLNNGKVFYNFNYECGDNSYTTALIEMRFPKWQFLQNTPEMYAGFRLPGSVIKKVEVAFISGNKSDNENVHDDDMVDALRRTLYATFTVEYLTDGKDPSTSALLHFKDIPMRVWFRSKSDRRALQWKDLQSALSDSSKGGLAGRYLELVKKADVVMKDALNTLQHHRNLCEDFYSVKPVEVEDIAVCTDIDVEQDADVDSIMAQAFFLIDRYFSPEIKFYTLNEMLEKKASVEEIFEGPELNNGFLDNIQVDSTNLKSNLYASNVINLLMDIPGVKAVRNFLFSKFDDEGKQVGESQPWKMTITPLRQPRLYLQASKIMPYKNGLYFSYTNEVDNILEVLRGQNSCPKITASEKDLTSPVGTWTDLIEYFPVQYQLPLTYGVGYEGLSGNAPVERTAKALQLKAYLLFFEQLLVNYLAQLSHITDIFNICDETIDKTYFVKYLNDSILNNSETKLYNGLSEQVIHDLFESTYEFLDRRNRFLDHQLSRFAESFSEYALMLYNYEQTEKIASDLLIKRKIDFLKDIRVMSHNRGKAINYKDTVVYCDPDSDNQSGLAIRIKRLLGLSPPDDTVMVVEHLLLRPRNKNNVRFLDVCVSSLDKSDGKDDPYSFRLTIIICGEGGDVNSNIQWRQFAEKTIRKEVPAHIGVKICWVSPKQLENFRKAYCAWLEELSKDFPNKDVLSENLSNLIKIFKNLKSVYPPATLFSCRESTNDDRVYLNQTVVTS